MECPNCKSFYEVEPAKCSSCGYPFAGAQSEKSAFIGQQIMKAGKIGDSKTGLKSAKIILYGIAIINMIWSTALDSDAADFVLTTIISGSFFVFGFFLEKRPFLFLILPIVLLLLIYTTNALIDPATLLQGVKQKVFYLGLLTYALILHIRSEKIKKESEYLSKQ